MPTINKLKRKYYGNDKQAYQKRQKVYQNPIWKKMRLAKLMEKPLCYVCEIQGKTKLAEHLHHLHTFTQETDQDQINRLAFDSNNIVPLCSHHHWQIHHGYLKGATSLDELKQYLFAHLKSEGKDIPKELQDTEQKEEENNDWFF